MSICVYAPEYLKMYEDDYEDDYVHVYSKYAYIHIYMCACIYKYVYVCMCIVSMYICISAYTVYRRYCVHMIVAWYTHGRNMIYTWS